MGTASSIHGSGCKGKRKVIEPNEINRTPDNNMPDSNKDDNIGGKNDNNVEAEQNKGTNKVGGTYHCIRADKNAAIVVHGCTEEYQTLVDELPEIIMKQLGPNMIAHPMILGKYCLVRDNENDEDHLHHVPIDKQRKTPDTKFKVTIAYFWFISTIIW
uniref:SJCHGC08683 protein n=1 Tax=Schistosoma japonicum TaxID=6182 RepID=Q5DE97_SCHJA|nr:SJCHGC08683 protein [Schistosoma japonicum]